MARKKVYVKTEDEERLMTIIKRSIKDGVVAKEMSYQRFKRFYRNDDYMHKYMKAQYYGYNKDRFASASIYMITDGRLFNTYPVSSALLILHTLRVVKEMNDDKFAKKHFSSIISYLNRLSGMSYCGKLDTEIKLLKSNRDFITSTLLEYYGDKFTKDTIDCTINLLENIGDKNISDLPL